MYYYKTAESKVISKFVMKIYKPVYEQLKRQCKHQVMVTNGVQHAVIAILKSHTLEKEGNTLPLNMDFELYIAPSSTLPTYSNTAPIFEQPLVLYMPDESQCQKWANSGEARKAFIKDVLKSLKETPN